MKLLKEHVVMPEELTFNSSISFTAKGLYAYLLLFRHSDLSPANIAVLVPDKEKDIISALKELHNAGYLKLEDDELPVTKDKRDPSVQELITYFETKFDLTMPRVQYQRYAAKTLVQTKGLEICKKAIDAAYVVRGVKYAPKILSVEDLRDKWNMLVDYYKRESKQQNNDRLRQVAIHKVTGSE